MTGSEPFARGLCDGPVVSPLHGPFGFALTVDVEEWYHTCLVPSYVRPEGRPPKLGYPISRPED